MIRAGNLRSRVNIERELDPADRGLAGETQPKWQVIERGKGVAAQIQGVGGGEKVRGVMIEAGITSLVTVRWRADIKPSMRLVYQSNLAGVRVLNISRAIDPDGRKTELMLLCEENVNDRPLD